MERLVSVIGALMVIVMLAVAAAMAASVLYFLVFQLAQLGGGR